MGSQVLGQLRTQPATTPSLCAQVVDDLDAYVNQWAQASGTCNGSFRWQTEIDPDELEYVTYAFYNLDLRLCEHVGRQESVPGPPEGRTFYLVLVRALLDALAGEGAARAAFAEQLRLVWLSAAQAE